MYPIYDKYMEEYYSPLNNVYNVQEFNELTENCFSNIKNPNTLLYTKISYLSKINSIIFDNNKEIEPQKLNDIIEKSIIIINDLDINSKIRNESLTTINFIVTYNEDFIREYRLSIDKLKQNLSGLSNILLENIKRPEINIETKIDYFETVKNISCIYQNLNNFQEFDNIIDQLISIINTPETNLQIINSSLHMINNALGYDIDYIEQHPQTISSLEKNLYQMSSNLLINIVNQTPEEHKNLLYSGIINNLVFIYGKLNNTQGFNDIINQSISLINTLKINLEIKNDFFWIIENTMSTYKKSENRQGFFDTVEKLFLIINDPLIEIEIRNKYSSTIKKIIFHSLEIYNLEETINLMGYLIRTIDNNPLLEIEIKNIILDIFERLVYYKINSVKEQQQNINIIEQSLSRLSNILLNNIENLEIEFNTREQFFMMISNIVDIYKKIYINVDDFQGVNNLLKQLVLTIDNPNTSLEIKNKLMYQISKITENYNFYSKYRYFINNLEQQININDENSINYMNNIKSKVINSIVFNSYYSTKQFNTRKINNLLKQINESIKNEKNINLISFSFLIKDIVI